MKIIMTIFALLSAPAFAATDYSCGGTEPFWTLSLTDAKATFTDDGNLTKVELAKPTYNNAGATDAVVYSAANQGQSLTGFLLNANDSIVVDKQGNPPANQDNYAAYCSDGMSNKLYPYTTTLVVNGKAYYGCCETKENPALNRQN